MMARRLRIYRAYRRVFAGPDGRTVLHDLMRRNGLLATSQVDGDPHRTAFNEGRRAAVLELLSVLRLTEADLMQLSEERLTDDD